jgi:diguanylate cyclase (GGDEF)-like protein
MQIRTKKGIGAFVGVVSLISFTFVNGLSYLLIAPDLFWAHRMLANIELFTLSLTIGTYVGFKLRQNTLLSDQLEFAVNHDHLTGASTRSHLYEFMFNSDIWPCVLIITDIDHFKSVNDQYGHQAGDAILKSFVAGLWQHTCGRGIVARFGGEEFVIVMPQTTLDAGCAYAERMRADTASRTVDVAGEKLAITASFGVSTVSDPTDIDTAIRRADEALYRAKNGGRNRVRVTPPAPWHIAASA